MPQNTHYRHRKGLQMPICAAINIGTGHIRPPYETLHTTGKMNRGTDKPHGNEQCTGCPLSQSTARRARAGCRPRCFTQVQPDLPPQLRNMLHTLWYGATPQLHEMYIFGQLEFAPIPHAPNKVKPKLLPCASLARYMHGVDTELARVCNIRTY